MDRHKLKISLLSLLEQFREYQTTNQEEMLKFTEEFWVKTSKLVFDFVNNIVVVATLSYAASKTNSWVLLFTSFCLGMILLVELISRLEGFFLKWLFVPSAPRGAAVGVSLLISLLSYVVIFGVVERFEASFKM
ncbi:hypothetical protein [Methylobacterium goesingense]|uniref:Uncharacterized protein n=1 Tax=Methylobacterium goesingense TaxID=243690 RepID=A0ABV2L2T8_9HYPH|nr:hypothetical protein [Methylobacterium goesingense]